ncbi:MAG: DUF4139 domain-containing protein [Alphaproteobacteria bacterium]|nr:DUF4139 domain-containing protein [Alphaproteobacteria bacterium]OJV46342.1 MAG: hypothetical protein BGO28_03185 [Alphaproteobacteria bacterium 43-37]
MNNPLFKVFVATVAVLFSYCLNAQDKSPANRERIQLTVYDNNLAFVRDARSIHLKQGRQQVTFRGISRQLIPSTLLMRILDNDFGVQILEQSFALQPATYKDLLERAIGQNITFTARNPVTQKYETLQGILINPEMPSVLIVDVDGHVQRYMGAYVNFNNSPSHIMPFPSLHTVFESAQETSATVEMSYITPGVGWSMNYTAEVNESDDTVDFLGLATVQNQTLIDFHQAEMMLVATPSPKKATLNEAKPSKDPESDDAMREAKPKGEKTHSLQKDTEAQEFRTRDLRGNSYPITKLVDLAPRQTKNIVYTQAQKITGERQFWLVINTQYDKDSDGAIQQVPVTTMISIANAPQSGLGLPLPRGNLLVYHKTQSDFAKVSDQNRINHTAIDGKIPLRLGDAEGIVASAQQTDYKQLGPRVIEVGYRIIIKNHRDRSALIRVLKELKPQHTHDVNVSRENHPHKRENGLLWVLEVPARDHQELRYRLRITYPEESE